jgi:RHS repeat-associated protein
LLSAVLLSLLSLAAAGASGEDPPGNTAPSSPDQGPERIEELPGRATATSNTYLLDNGALETHVFQVPVNYRDEEGDWTPIDESIEGAPNGGLTNAANSFDLQLPDQLGAGSVRLSEAGQWFSYRLLGAQTDEAEVEDATAVYDSAGGDLSFELHSLSNGVKEQINLADSSQPRRYNFALDFSEGLTPTLQDDGSIAVEDGDGAVFATLPAPTISDASGDPPADAVHYILQEGSGGGEWALAVEVDEAWISDPARTWPVSIDPSAFLSTNLDCSVGSTPLPAGWAACGSGGSSELTVAYSQKENQPVRSFLRFSLSGVPNTAYVQQAKLRLYSPNAAENSPAGIETRRITKSWNTTLNWERRMTEFKWTNPGGDFNGEGKAVLTPADRGGALAGWWDLESDALEQLVGEWARHEKPNGLDNYGVIVKQADETKTECEANSANCNRRFVSFNSSAAASNRPELDLIYFPKAPSTNKMISPTDGTTTARRLPLRAQWAAGVSGIRFQYRAGKKVPFSDIPASLLRNGKGEAVEQLPVSETCCQSEPLYLDAAHLNSELQAKGGTIQVRALFEGGTGPGYSEPVEAVVDRYLGGPKDETTGVGPGTLDLLTGNLSLSANDVSISGFNPLSFGRSYDTRVPGSSGEKTALGQGWKSGAELAGGSEWANLKMTSSSEEIEGITYTFEYATLTPVRGAPISFEKVGTVYEAPAELEGYSLVLSEGRFILTAPNGNKTTFTNEGSGNTAEYLPTSVSELGSGAHSTVMTWAFLNGQKRLVREVAPTSSRTPAGCASSPTTTTGCRTLEFTYAPATKWGAPSAYGERLEKITFYAPGEGGPWEAAVYSYDTLGRLVSEWDPRISPNLKTTYTYEGEKLRKVTPPGEEPWTFEYAPQMDGEQGAVSRLKAVKRSNLQGGETKTSIRYEVPLSSSGAPYEMGLSSISTWGQTDVPTDATAVFPPTEVPGEPAAAYTKATVFYMDSEGFGVNVATPQGAGMAGAAITTTEADEFGNVTRELSPQNRLRALAEPEAKRAERSHLLETKYTYSADGTMLLDERGPLHQVKLQEGGEVAEARLHRTIAYENPANLNPAPLVPTREVTGAIFPSKGTESDQRVTETKYNWSLIAPTETIVDAGVGHLNIKKRVTYDEATGRVVETRQPKATEEAGNVPGATITVYYEGPKPNDDCNFAGDKWAGLPCEIKPAAQPESGPPLPITKINSYSPLGKPTEIVEEIPGAGEAGIRKTVITYDSAGRQTSKKVTGGGQAVPKVEYLYSSTNGMPTTQKFVCETGECAGFDTQATTKSYDALGRVTTYEDADGNKSETTYDSFGRTSTFYDGKGTQTVEYDSATSLVTKLTDSAAGIFTAGYDADGNMVKRGLPDGLTAEATIDPAGAAIGLTYIKASNCGASCTWLSFSAKHSIYGQTLSESSSLETNQYAYDRAGRLTEAQETPVGGNCTSRSYGYDKDFNRLSMTTVASALGGACGTGSPTEKKYSYDKADRLIDSGVVYDNFGRITTLPASDAGGKSLTTSYFATDMVATQAQNGITNSFELDASLRQRSRLQGGGGLEGNEIFHYGTAADSPAWTQRGSVWTRNIGGIEGELVALQESGKEITLPLMNLHGDVVATAAIDPAATALKGTFSYDEFGNPTSGSAGRFGWLGGMQRQTELSSGVVQMGARSYVPSIGRFLSTDPIAGGSANAYDYANQDPINSLDPSGRKPYARIHDGVCVGGLHVWSPKRSHERGGYGAFYARMFIKCEANAGTILTYVNARLVYEKVPGSGNRIDEFEINLPNTSNEPVGWNNWKSKPPFKWDCLLGVEYQVTIYVSYQQGTRVPEYPEMKAQEVCGHGRY